MVDRIARLDALRKRHRDGWTWEQVAARAGISSRTIRALAREEWQEPRRRVLVSLARALRVPLADLRAALGLDP